MFKTGLRISEFCGLIKSDIDFANGSIRVERQLQRKSNMEYIIEEPKTSCGQRYIPMDEEVVECFRRILENRKIVSIEPVINRIHGFLFLIKIVSRWSRCTGKSIFNISARNIIRFTKLKCQKSHLMCVGIRSVLIKQKAE